MPSAQILNQTGLIILSNFLSTLIIFWLSMGTESCYGSQSADSKEKKRRAVLMSSVVSFFIAVTNRAAMMIFTLAYVVRLLMRILSWLSPLSMKRQNYPLKSTRTTTFSGQWPWLYWHSEWSVSIKGSKINVSYVIILFTFSDSTSSSLRICSSMVLLSMFCISIGRMLPYASTSLRLNSTGAIWLRYSVRKVQSLALDWQESRFNESCFYFRKSIANIIKTTSITATQQS